MTTGNERDLYQRFELEVRTPKKRLLVDAFLPAPETLPSAVAPAPPPPPAVFQTDELGALGRLDEEEEPKPRPRPRKRVAAKKKDADAPERSLSLQEEIAEFMNRGGTALAPEDDSPSSRPGEPAATAPPVIPDDPTDSGSEGGS